MWNLDPETDIRLRRSAYPVEQLRRRHVWGKIVWVVYPCGPPTAAWIDRFTASGMRDDARKANMARGCFHCFRVNKSRTLSCYTKQSFSTSAEEWNGGSLVWEEEYRGSH